MTNNVIKIDEELARQKEWHADQLEDRAARRGRDGAAVSGDIMTAPPGFVGQLAAWIRTQPRDSRDHLAVAAALSVVGNCAGAGFTCDYGANPNAFMFCVAGSSTGKENVLQAQTALHIAAGIHGQTYGEIKSKQEMVRNLLSNPTSLYLIDEIGSVLGAIKRASGQGGAAYMDGIISSMMSIYSKCGADSHFLVSGDIKRDLEDKLKKEIAALEKKHDAGGEADKLLKVQAAIDDKEAMLEMLESGIRSPFLSIMGYTNHATFDDLMTSEWVANGFFARALIFDEPDNNPLPNAIYMPSSVPEIIKNQLLAITSAGRTVIHTTPDARELLDEYQKYFHGWASKLRPDLIPIPRRGFEMVLKLSLLLGVAGRERTAAHVEWAMAMVQRDIELKLRKVLANDSEGSAAELLKSKVLGKVSTDTWIKQGDIANSLRAHGSKDAVIAMLGDLEMLGHVEHAEKQVRGRLVISWRAL